MRTQPNARTHPWLRPTVVGFRALLALLTTLVFVQAVLAGQFLSGDVALRAVHGTIGDDVLPWLAGAQLLLAILVWWPARGPWWPAPASLVLLVAIVIQLSLGFAGRVDLHVPLGVAIFGVTIGLLAGTRRLAAIPEEEASDRQPSVCT